MLEVFPCDPKAVVLCPFDSDASEFVKVLTERGHKVIHNIEDFLENDYEFDCLYTNPPFSFKDKIIEKCIESGKPCTLLLPLDVLGGVKRHSLFKKTNISVYVPTRRIHFVSGENNREGGPSMHSIFLQINSKVNSIRYEYQDAERIEA